MIFNLSGIFQISTPLCIDPRWIPSQSRSPVTGCETARNIIYSSGVNTIDAAHEDANVAQSNEILDTINNVNFLSIYGYQV